jgi:hypothetical protein
MWARCWAVTAYSSPAMLDPSAAQYIPGCLSSMLCNRYDGAVQISPTKVAPPRLAWRARPCISVPFTNSSVVGSSALMSSHARTRPPYVCHTGHHQQRPGATTDMIPAAVAQTTSAGSIAAVVPAGTRAAHASDDWRLPTKSAATGAIWYHPAQALGFSLPGAYREGAGRCGPQAHPRTAACFSRRR